MTAFFLISVPLSIIPHSDFRSRLRANHIAANIRKNEEEQTETTSTDERDMEIMSLHFVNPVQKENVTNRELIKLLT